MSILSQIIWQDQWAIEEHVMPYLNFCPYPDCIPSLHHHSSNSGSDSKSSSSLSKFIKQLQLFNTLELTKSTMFQQLKSTIVCNQRTTII
jgi:hypothetical protein